MAELIPMISDENVTLAYIIAKAIPAKITFDWTIEGFDVANKTVDWATEGFYVANTAFHSTIEGFDKWIFEKWPANDIVIKLFIYIIMNPIQTGTARLVRRYASLSTLLSS